MDGEAMDAAGDGLRVIANMAVGYDNIDVGAATERGVIVTNTPGVLDETTADVAFMLVLAAARRLGEGERLLRAGKWEWWGPKQLRGLDVWGKTLGIVGMRSEEHTSELQSRQYLVCRLLLEKKK